MEVLSRVTVRMGDPGVNCVSLDWLLSMDLETVFAVKSTLSVLVPENSLTCVGGATEGCRAALTVPLFRALPEASMAVGSVLGPMAL